jgi:NDP-sugar pyrophosphorylase family protein
MHIRGVILAAGAGVRAHPLTDNIPKALVSVAGRTLLEWSLRSFCFAGFQNITVAIGCKAQLIEDYLQSNEKQKNRELSIDIVHVQNYEIGPLQTVLTAIETFPDEEFFISPVDAVVETDIITAMIERHTKTKDMILAVDFTANSGTPVYVDKAGIIVGLGNTAPEGAFSVGRSVMLLIAHNSIVDYCRSALSRKEKRLVYVLNQMINDGMTIYSHDVRSKWFDVDTLPDILLLNRHLLERSDVQNIPGSIFIFGGDLMEINNRLALKDSDLVVNNNVLLEGPVLLSPGCRIGQDCRIGPNVTIGSSVKISDSCELINTIVYSNSVVQSHTRVENAIVYDSQVYQVGL